MAFGREQRKPKRRRGRRRVRFNTKQNKEYKILVDDNTWLSGEEYAQVRVRVVGDVRIVANSALRLKDLLEVTVLTESKDEDNNELPHRVDRNANSEEILERLTEWTQTTGRGRGLEHLINRELGNARRKHRTRSIRAVIEGQEIVREGKHHDERGELLRLISQRHSAPAKKHALMMGSADESAAQTGL